MLDIFCWVGLGYDLDVTNLGRSNTYEFKFKRKKIVLESGKPKSNVGNNKEGTITDKNNKHHVTGLNLHQKLWSIDLLPHLRISSVFSSRRYSSYCHSWVIRVTFVWVACHIKRYITIIHYNYQSAAKSHKRLQELAVGDEVLIRVHPERFFTGNFEKTPYSMQWSIQDFEEI